MKPDRTERWNIRRHKHLKMSIFRKSSAQIPTPRKNNSSAFAFFHESIERTQIKKALQLQSFQKTRGPFFDKNVRKTDLIHMTSVAKKDVGTHRSISKTKITQCKQLWFEKDSPACTFRGQSARSGVTYERNALSVRNEDIKTFIEFGSDRSFFIREGFIHVSLK